MTGFIFGVLVVGVITGVVCILRGVQLTHFSSKYGKDEFVKQRDKIKDEIASLEPHHKERIRQLESEVKPIQERLADLDKRWAEAGQPTKIESAYGKAILCWGNVESCLRRKGIINGREGQPGQAPTKQKIMDSNLPADVKFQLQQLWGSRNAYVHGVGDAKQDAHLVDDALHYARKCDRVLHDLESYQSKNGNNSQPCNQRSTCMPMTRTIGQVCCQHSVTTLWSRIRPLCSSSMSRNEDLTRFSV